MPAGLNLPTNISLQTASDSGNPEIDGNSESSGIAKDGSGFASVMSKISSETTKIGKSLPEDGAIMAENQRLQDQSHELQQVIDAGAIPLAGDIRLVTGEAGQSPSHRQLRRTHS